MPFFAYIHSKPDGTPFYVGKGVRTRYKNFRDRSTHHKRVVAKYGAENILIGKLDCSTNETALLLEVGLIKCLRRMGVSLVNLTNGGEGNVGWRCPDTVRKAVSLANKRRLWTDEQKKRIGNIHRGKQRPEHSALMKSRGLWLGSNNPVFAIDQRAAKNPSARAIVGVHPDFGCKSWDTLTAASQFLGVTPQAVAQALKRAGRAKGWRLEYADGL